MRRRIPSKPLIALAVVVLIAVQLRRCSEGDRVRSQYMRFRSEARSMQTALETYYLDHQCWPASRPIVGSIELGPIDRWRFRRAGGWGLSLVEPGRPGLDGLTTPVAYMMSLVLDPLAPGGRIPYAYHVDGKGWIVFSPGPDRDYDIRNPAYVYDGSIPQPSAQLLAGGPWTYDPTNGLSSNGDLWHVRN